MKVMILGAGRGKRMRHLTADMPKPLISLWGRPLVEWQLVSLKKAGFKEFVINTAYLGTQIIEYLGDGSKFGVKIEYSSEGERAEDALETRGGIVKALTMLVPHESNDPFVVVSGDIVTDFPYSSLRERAKQINSGEAEAHLVLVPNPSYHACGDMSVQRGRITRKQRKYTYGNIGVFSPSLFRGLSVEKMPLFPWLYEYVDKGRVSGEVYEGNWANIGTPEELEKFENLSPYLV